MASISVISLLDRDRLEPAFDRAACPLDRFERAGDDVLGVGEQERCLDLEGDLSGVFGGIDRAFGLGVAYGGLDPREPVAQERDEAIADRDRVACPFRPAPMRRSTPRGRSRSRGI